MQTANLPAIRACRPAWNKGRIVGQKRPLLPKHVWAIRVRLEIADKVRVKVVRGNVSALAQSAAPAAPPKKEKDKGNADKS